MGSIWALYRSNIRWKKLLLGIMVIIYLLSGAGFFFICFATRMHYSFDIWIAAALWYLLLKVSSLWDLAYSIACYFAPPKVKGGRPWVYSLEDVPCLTEKKEKDEEDK